ncbi:TetR/AcrR family transcriptional regulator C-terminal ligand-binding domain-containing protein [Nocardia uniformis]|uniref:TetR/AcrR family transcriptional regulator C-terminal ligand-binding domain-containing protein n=1 Tax=Nocardia uniformis TaxID=53432 RepID=A0A849BUK7_9NOCA|nr:TetR-like C-terminal domain-containing protein [Nocardia uniformis]NNH69864.1 TetR/AcrR family transcriptional regulator C-terminal ligand-binding domain-containing protein [Nocardia uniformis]
MSAATSPSPHVGSRPGGRSARVRAAVHRAVQDLLTDETGELPTIPVVAARAGVHATTVYRRWGDVGELLADVATSRFSGDIVVPDTGTLRGDLVRYACDLAKDLADPDTLTLVRATVGIGGGHGVAACRGEHQRQLEAILERERVRGGRPPSLERTTDAVLAPLYYRAVFTNEPLAPECARNLVTLLLADWSPGLRRRPVDGGN